MRHDTPDSHREYIRHPVNIPVEIRPADDNRTQHYETRNISYGGLSFHSPRPLSPGDIVRLKIRTVRPIFKVKAIVQWCMEHEEGYEIGVKFLDKEDAFRARMMEQIYHIREYRKRKNRGRSKKLSKEEAGIEWVEKHAKDFPTPE